MADIEQYASYNVLARKPLLGGVPIITLVIFLCLILVSAFGGVLLFGFAKGLIVPIILCTILFTIRIKCMDDSRAVDAFAWDMKGVITRIICRSSVTSYTSTDDSPKRRKEKISDWYKHYRD